MMGRGDEGMVHGLLLLASIQRAIPCCLSFSFPFLLFSFIFYFIYPIPLSERKRGGGWVSEKGGS